MTALLIIMLILAILVGIAIIALFIFALIDYFESYVGYIDQHGPKIKFSIFYLAYNSNSEHWDIDNDDYIACYMPKRQRFHFSYIDTYRYRLWKRMIEKKDAKAEDEEIVNNMLEFVKQNKENNEC